MAEHTPGYVVEHAPRQTWAYEVRWTNNLGGFAEAGRCFARCPSEREAQKIADALNARDAAARAAIAKARGTEGA